MLAQVTTLTLPADFHYNSSQPFLYIVSSGNSEQLIEGKKTFLLIGFMKYGNGVRVEQKMGALTVRSLSDTALVMVRCVFGQR